MRRSLVQAGSIADGTGAGPEPPPAWGNTMGTRTGEGGRLTFFYSMDEHSPTELPFYHTGRALTAQEVDCYIRWTEAAVRAPNGGHIMRRVGREAKEGDEQVKKE
jgi:hypothetical protein